jgi:hypothetical protein
MSSHAAHGARLDAIGKGLQAVVVVSHVRIGRERFRLVGLTSAAVVPATKATY